MCRVNDAAEALCLIEQPDFADKLGLVISGHHTRGIGGPAFVAELRLPDACICRSWSWAQLTTLTGDYGGGPVVFPAQALWAREKMLAVTSQILAHHRNAVA